MIYFLIISILISIINISTSVPIGGNIYSLRDRIRSLPYVNLIRQARGKTFKLHLVKKSQRANERSNFKVNINIL